MRRPRADHRRRLRGLRDQGREHRRPHLGRSRTRTSARSQYDCAAANTALDKLGYKRGSDGIRVVPATTGANAQAGAPDGVRDPHADLDRLQRRPRVRDRPGRLRQARRQGDAEGRRRHDRDLRDRDRRLLAGPRASSTQGFDIAMWDWVGYIDPDFMLSVVTKAPVVLVERHRLRTTRPTTSSTSSRARRSIPSKRQADRLRRCRRSSTTTSTTPSSSNELAIDAHAKGWTGFDPRARAATRSSTTPRPHEA